MNNSSMHTNGKSKETIITAGIKALTIPPYFRELNAAEKVGWLD
jgi:transposase